MKNKLFTALMAIMTLVGCQSADEDATVANNGMSQVGFNLAGEFQVEDGALSRAVTPECYYIAVSKDTPADGKISSGYAGYFTSLSSVTLALPKGEYTFYISAFKSAGYTIDWATDYSSLTANTFTEVTTPIAYAPCFADQKVDRYYGKVTQTINENTTVTVDGKRFAYGINVNIAAPLEGKVTVSSESPAFSYTVSSTDAAKVEQNIFCLAGEDPATASKSTTVTMNLYDATNKVVATTSKTLTIARNHSKTIKVSAVDPKASFAFNVEDGNMTNDGEEDLTPKEEEPKAKTFTANGVTFKMMPVAEGTFTMGATSEQINSGLTVYDDEKPTHQVTLSDYYIGETEVTQALWYAVMGASPSSSYSWSSSSGLGDNYPAYNISWEECQTFITNLNTLTGATFRMPTEAEWEYAARGGSKSQGYIFSGSNTIGDVAWYTENSSSTTHQVKTKSPNELGIYDMSGNVWEWCSDWWGAYSSSSQTNPTGPTSGSGRVYRGGCWGDDAIGCRVAYRSAFAPSCRCNRLGMRLALSQK